MCDKMDIEMQDVSPQQLVEYEKMFIKTDKERAQDDFFTKLKDDLYLKSMSSFFPPAWKTALQQGHPYHITVALAKRKELDLIVSSTSNRIKKSPLETAQLLLCEAHQPTQFQNHPNVPFFGPTGKPIPGPGQPCPCCVIQTVFSSYIKSVPEEEIKFIERMSGLLKCIQ